MKIHQDLWLLQLNCSVTEHPHSRTRQVLWPVSGVCRYPNQVVPEVSRYPNQCQGYAGTLTSVRGVQVPYPYSVRECRYPDRCQRYADTLTMQCQGSAGTLTSVRGDQVPWPVSGGAVTPTSVRVSVFHFRSFLFAPSRIPQTPNPKPHGRMYSIMGLFH